MNNCVWRLKYQNYKENNLRYWIKRLKSSDPFNSDDLDKLLFSLNQTEKDLFCQNIRDELLVIIYQKAFKTSYEESICDVLQKRILNSDIYSETLKTISEYKTFNKKTDQIVSRYSRSPLNKKQFNGVLKDDLVLTINSSELCLKLYAQLLLDEIIHMDMEVVSLYFLFFSCKFLYDQGNYYRVLKLLSKEISVSNPKLGLEMILLRGMCHFYLGDLPAAKSLFRLCRKKASRNLFLREYYHRVNMCEGLVGLVGLSNISMQLIKENKQTYSSNDDTTINMNKTLSEVAEFYNLKLR